MTKGLWFEDVRRSFHHQLRTYIDQVFESSRSTLQYPETIIPLHPISFFHQFFSISRVSTFDSNTVVIIV